MTGEVDENRAPRPSSRWAGAAALGVLLLVAVASSLALLPVAPHSATAPADEFTAERAMAHVTQLARAPRPVGSAHHEWARGYLVDQLRSLGWAVEVQEAVATSDLGTGPTRPVAAVSNVIARLPGSVSTGSVVLAAHYDTVAGSPGAGDDGIGLGVVLETARALTAGQAAQPGSQRNDVVALLTDAEEPGLLGAEAFARERAPALGTAAVLNHEARGEAGSPFVLRMTSPNGVLTRTLAGAPGPLAESTVQATFDMLPYGTDFTPFDAAGLSVIDTVVSARAAHYHTPVDAVEHLSAASLQQMGDNTLAVARELADMDLATVGRGGQDLVTTLPWGLLRFPAGLEVPLAAAALVLALAVVGVERGHRGLTLPKALLAAVLSAVTLAVAAAAAFAVWRVAVLVDPAQASVVTGEPYRPVPYQVAVLLAAAAVVALVAGLLRRRLGLRAFDCGCLLGFAGVGMLAALTAPGTSYTLVLPTLTTAAAVLAAALLPGVRPVARTLVLLVSLVPAATMLGPAVWLGFEGGIGLAGPASAVLLAVLLLLALPVLRPGEHLRERHKVARWDEPSQQPASWR